MKGEPIAVITTVTLSTINIKNGVNIMISTSLNKLKNKYLKKLRESMSPVLTILCMRKEML